MRSILEQLDDDQAVLLIYLAGELPPADQATVQQRLASDEQFRSQFESLRASQQQIAQMLDGLDAAQPVPGSAASNQREISRLMKQWQAAQLVRNSRFQARPQATSKWIWIGPAVAAMVLIGWGVWWGIQPDKYSPIPNTVADTTSNAQAGEAGADDNALYTLVDNPADLYLSYGDLKEPALMSADADVNYVQSLAELTTLPLPQ